MSRKGEKLSKTAEERRKMMDTKWPNMEMKRRGEKSGQKYEAESFGFRESQKLAGQILSETDRRGYFDVFFFTKVSAYHYATQNKNSSRAAAFSQK